VRRRLHILARVHLGHATDPATPQPRIRVAVPPAVYGPLDKTPLASERHIEMRQGPSDPVAVCLVEQTVSTVVILVAASARVDAVLLLEFRRQFFSVHRLDVAPNGVLHLDSVPRVLERDPLHTVSVLSDDRRRGRWDRPRSSVGVDSSRGVSRALEGAVLRVVRRRHGRRLWLVERQGNLRLHLGPRTVGHWWL